MAPKHFLVVGFSDMEVTAFESWVKEHLDNESTIAVPGADFPVKWPVWTILKTKSYYHLCGTNGEQLPPSASATKGLKLAMEELFSPWLN